MSYQLSGAAPAAGGEIAPVAAGGAAVSRDVSVLFREHHAELVRLAVLMVGDRHPALRA
jgi:hypothetical protein